MTLYLKIHELSGLDHSFKARDVYLFVEGSQSGLLTSKPGARALWDPAFQIICSDTDNLVINAYEDQNAKPSSFLGECQFHSPVFIKTNKNELISRNLQDEDQKRYLKNEIDVERQNKYHGTLKMSVRYDKAQKYEGQFPSARDITLTPPHSKPVQFYKGKCATTNLFSFLDSKAKGQKFKAIQSLYRDNKQQQ